MERMEVEPCACAAGGGALRRSNSAPMITSVSDGSTVFGSSSSARFRRSSVSVNPSGPSQLLPLSSFPLNTDRTETKRHEDLSSALRGSLQRLSASSLTPAPAASHWSHSTTWSPPQDSGVTPNSSPSPTRRFRPAVRWPTAAPLKRKGGVESDGPPKKLFVAGVSEPHRNFSVSVSEASDSPPLSAPPSFSSFSPHQH
ncbi:P2R1A-PPP2R2A-interacting phosphatase regulator 1 [Periophthalmus magnuspinnatus]|uniref:P2R1A-PPP2R2A-interacting phosphatase regulator 1 n=1 Tax=Periophthalmus magnuspinnatus TaxID=409849 RepID=UPI00145A0DCE|nr:P2R1A-PPP2R2A-interacting phosphatase regulator 1 [Periophthalmus magnuspinnatus]